MKRTATAILVFLCAFSVVVPPSLFAYQADVIANDPTVNIVEDPAPTVDTPATETPTEPVETVVVETPTPEPTQTPVPTIAPTEIPTEIPADVPTDVPTETEIVTEPPVETVESDVTPTIEVSPTKEIPVETAVPSVTPESETEEPDAPVGTPSPVPSPTAEVASTPQARMMASGPVEVTISPNIAMAGDVVRVTGTGFEPGERVTITWPDYYTPPLGYVTVSADGVATGRVTIPTVDPIDQANGYAIHMTGQTSDLTAYGIVHMADWQEKTASLSVTSALPGEKLRVSGTGFSPGERVDIRWNTSGGQLLGYVSASTSGTLSGSVLVPASATGGSYQIYLVAPSGQASAALTVTAPPKANVSISDNYVTQGDIISIQGWNFRPGEQVTITLPGNVILGRVTVRSNGTFSGKIKIPATLPAGYHTITSRGGSSGFSAGIRVEVWGYVYADVTLIPTSGAGGSVVRFTGSGFQPRERVNVIWDGDFQIGYITASSSGTISGAVTVPASPGVYQHYIEFVGVTSKQNTLATFTITRELAPTTTLSPTSARGGDIVTILGTGFRPNESVTIYWGKQYGPKVGVVIANTNGSFTGRITIPKSALAGNHSIITVGNRSYDPISVTIKVTASPVAKLSASSTSGEAGKIIYLSGSGFGPNEALEVRWSPGGETTGTIFTDENGSFKENFDWVPWSATPGTYTITVSGELSKRTASMSFYVTKAAFTYDSHRNVYAVQNPIHIQTIG